MTVRRVGKNENRLPNVINGPKSARRKLKVRDSALSSLSSLTRTSSPLTGSKVKIRRTGLS